jgi:2-oxoisovalerate dehydrogenase E1 component
MLLSRKLDDKEIQLKTQSQIFFQISGAGHEAICVAAGLTLRPGYDWFFPYYRDRALCLQLGMTPLDMLLAGVGAKDDPNSGGRQMPSHWGHPKLHIVSASSPTGTQVLHAVGAAEAGVIYSRVRQIQDRAAHFQPDEISYVSLGEGATSEGEFWESLNAACTKQLPVLFLVEDNGYAISVPVEVQTAGGDISRLVRSFPGLHVDSIDGTDFFASLRAMREATRYVARARARRSSTRKSSAVLALAVGRREAVQAAGGARGRSARDPIARFAEFLQANGLATDDDSTAIAATSTRGERSRGEGARRAEAAKTRGAVVYLARRRSDVRRLRHAGAAEGKPDTMVAAINRTLQDEMARDPRIVVFGEDVGGCQPNGRAGDRVRQGRRLQADARAAAAGSATTACSTRPSRRPASSAARVGMAVRA